MTKAGNRKTLLLVEDEVLIAMNQKMQLEKYGYKIEHVLSGEKAVESSFGEEFHIDLILMDINLGKGADGTQAAEEILKYRDIPIVFLSSHTEPEVVEKTEKITSYGYVVKDSGITVLDASVKMAFKLFESRMKEKKKEEELQKNEEKMRTILNSMPDVVLQLDTNLKILWANKTTLKINQDAIGQLCYKALPGRTSLCPDCPIVKTLKTGEIERGIVHLQSVAGIGESYWDDIGVPIKDTQGKTISIVKLARNVTDSKLAEEALRESEGKHRLFFENAPVGIIHYNNRGIITDVNDVMIDVFGSSREKLIDLDINDIPNKKFSKEVIKTLEGRKGYYEDLYTSYTGRKESYIKAVWVPIIDDGKVVSGVGIVEDITERMQSAKKLQVTLKESQNHSKEISALLKCSQKLLGNIYFEDTAREIFDNCKKIIGATSGYIALLSHDGNENEVLFLDPGGLPCNVDPSLPMPIRGLRAEAYRSGKAVYENNFDKSKWKDFMPGGHVRLENVLFAPLLIDGKAVGLLGIANKPGGFDEKDLRLVTVFGGLAAIALKTSMAKKKVQENEERFRMLFEQAGDAMFVHNIEGQFVAVNKKACDSLGYSMDELMTRSVSDVEAGWDKDALRKLFSSLRQNKVMATFGEHRHKDGSTFPVEVSLRLSQWDDQTTMMVIARDITERKQIEEKQKQYQLMIETASEAIFYKDLESRYIIVNKKSLETFGLPLEKVVGKNDYEIMSNKKDAEKNIEDDQQVFKSGKPYDVLKHMTGEDGKEYFFHAVKVPLFDNDGKLIGLVGVARDITEKKKADEKIENLLEEKEIILKEVHHRIKNNMSVIRGLFSMKSQLIDNPEAVTAFQDAISRIESMGVLYDKLYRTENYRNVSINDYLSNLVDEIHQMFPDSQSVQIKKEIDDFVIDTKVIFPLGIIVNELLTNAMKYAFIDRDNGLIQISSEKKDNHVTLVFADNGIGMPEFKSKEEQKGFGLTLIDSLIEQIGGNFKIKRTNGTRFTIEFDV